MAVQTELLPDDEISRERRSARRPRDVVGPIVLALGIGAAGVLGVSVAAWVTNPPPPAPVSATLEPNANAREGRVPLTATREPNANAREGRVAATATREPNANEREGRVAATATQEPNANQREGRAPSR
jgi:hypothetical protein